MVRILLQQARRDRVTLPIWILGTALLLTTAATAVGSEYGDVTDRRGILAVALATPALLALRGIPNGDSLGSAVHFQSFAFLAVTIGLTRVYLGHHWFTDVLGAWAVALAWLAVVVTAHQLYLHRNGTGRRPAEGRPTVRDDTQ